MRKTSFLLPVFALLAGICGFFMRSSELKTAFEPDTGLAIRGTGITTALIALSIAVVAIAIIYAAVIASSRTSLEGGELAVFRGSTLYSIAALLTGLVTIIGAGMYYWSVRTITPFPTPDFVFAVFAVASGLCSMGITGMVFTGNKSNRIYFISVVPSLFFAFTLVMTYINNSSNPTLLSFAYRILAIAAITLSFYYEAGFVYNKTKIGRTIASHLVAIYFGTLMLADNIGTPMRLIFGASIALLLLNCTGFIAGLKHKNENPPE